MALSKEEKETIKEAGVLIKRELLEMAPSTPEEGEKKIGFVGFGTFKILMSKERKCRNPHTGEDMMSQSKLTPKFKFSKTFLED